MPGNFLESLFGIFYGESPVGFTIIPQLLPYIVNKISSGIPNRRPFAKESWFERTFWRAECCAQNVVYGASCDSITQIRAHSRRLNIRNVTFSSMHQFAEALKLRMQTEVHVGLFRLCTWLILLISENGGACGVDSKSNSRLIAVYLSPFCGYRN